MIQTVMGLMVGFVIGSIIGFYTIVHAATLPLNW